MIQSGWEPLPAVRGARHAAMLAWRRAVLAPFGHRVRRMPEDSPLWFWTDGFVYFQTAPRPSRTARALRAVEPPPWAAGKAAWGLPVQLFAAPDATFASFTNAVLRLRAAGFENLFVAHLNH